MSPTRRALVTRAISLPVALAGMSSFEIRHTLEPASAQASDPIELPRPAPDDTDERRYQIKALVAVFLAYGYGETAEDLMKALGADDVLPGVGHLLDWMRTTVYAADHCLQAGQWS
jgi:hypothetical protein